MATIVGGLLGAVSGVVGILADPDLLLPSVAIVAIGGLTMLGGVVLYRTRNTRWRIAPWVVVLAAMVTFAVFAVVLWIQPDRTPSGPDPAQTLPTSSGTASGPPTTSAGPVPKPVGAPEALISTPKNGDRTAKNSAVLVTGNLAGVDAAYCASHHVWLVHRTPSGRNNERLWTARSEIPCGNGPWQVRDEIGGQPYYEYSVRVVANAAGQEWMTDNKTLGDRRDASRDGEWVTLPDGTTLVSDLVTLTTT